jgi:hypothetical protein
MEFSKSQRVGKRTWQLARDLTGHKNSDNQDIGEIKNCSTNAEKAESFNQFYTNIAPKLARAVPSTVKHFLDYLPFIDNDVINPLKLKPVFIQTYNLYSRA